MPQRVKEQSRVKLVRLKMDVENITANATTTALRNRPKSR